jgi:RNA polymerase sigma-70 factor (ECF subfamily)
MDDTKRAGPEDGFSQWYAGEFARVRATVALATGDPGLAEEATAEAFARALVQWGRVRAMDRPTAWVHRVALNEVRSRWRRGRVERRYLERQAAGVAPPPPEPDPDLWAAVGQLPPRSREAIALRYVADLPEAQVAAVMGISRGAVASTLSKARTRLADLLTTPERSLP